MIRIHGMGTGELGTWLAGAIGVFGALGGGWLADKKGATDKRWYLWIPAFSTLGFIPFGVTTFMVDNVYISLISYCGVCYFSAMYLGPVLAVAMRLAGQNMRAMSSAVLFFIMNLIGMGMSPWLVGYGSDLFAPDLGVDSLRYSLITVMCIGSTWCFFHYYKAAVYVREDIGFCQD